MWRSFERTCLRGNIQSSVPFERGNVHIIHNVCAYLQQESNRFSESKSFRNYLIYDGIKISFHKTTVERVLFYLTGFDPVIHRQFVVVGVKCASMTDPATDRLVGKVPPPVKMCIVYCCR